MVCANWKQKGGGMANRQWRREEYDPIGGHHKHSVSAPAHNTDQDPPALLIKIRGLSDGDNPIDLSFDAALLDYPEFFNTANLKGIIRKEGDRLDLTAQVSVDGKFECTRCTDQFERKISTGLQLHFVPPRLAPNVGDPNVHTYDPTSVSAIDVLADIRDALILAIPMKNLCREDCKGLCPTCGKNRNREKCDCSENQEASGAWSALKGLSERLRAEEFKDPTRN